MVYISHIEAYLSRVGWALLYERAVSLKALHVAYLFSLFSAFVIFFTFNKARMLNLTCLRAFRFFFV